ncbi:hypothetical protein [Cumulibacter manganitolerans]|uniref:hypothetical protein n=1 Tax=Cumulibacter manganitolerans TaxID=1884992 RepID=UPI001297F860|nr:hypothetical protein [Cumulibacter manganitolerans]
MKTMTCNQLGGPCDLEHRGETADDVIKAQDAHLKEAVGGGDAAHQEAADAMSARWADPAGGMAWYEETKKSFDALPQG